MGKLNQVIAVEKGAKSKAQHALTNAYHTIQKSDLFNGVARTYQPKDEEGDKLPSESKPVQVNAADMLVQIAEEWVNWLDITATKDWANGHAKADVKVDGTVILNDVPVTFLLFLEKQLTDIHTFISKLPKLDPAEQWSYDENANQFATRPSESVKTKKVMKSHVLYEATKEHPAQVQSFTEDIMAGTWTTIKFSGALPAKDIADMTKRVDKLIIAVKTAREEANSIEAPEKHVGRAVFDYILG